MSILTLNKFRKTFFGLKRPKPAKLRSKKCLILKNHLCSTMVRLTRTMGTNMVKTAIDLNLATNLKYLIRQISPGRSWTGNFWSGPSWWPETWNGSTGVCEWPKKVGSCPCSSWTETTGPVSTTYYFTQARETSVLIFYIACSSCTCAEHANHLEKFRKFALLFVHPVELYFIISLP